MSVVVKLAGLNLTDQIDQNGLQVQQILGAQRDTATLIYKKYGDKTYVPQVFDTVLIQDIDRLDSDPDSGVGYGSLFYGLGFGNGYDVDGIGTKIFGGRIATIKQTNLNNADGIIYELDCVDYSIDLDSELVSQTYINQSIQDIIADFATNFSTGFTTTNVTSTYVIPSIVFNQVPISQAIKKLADLVQYNWYVDPDKDIHFFPKYTELAPFGLTDTSGNYVGKSLETDMDGTQLANQVKVRGGTYLANSFSDSITVKGNDSKSFKLPYQFNGLTITVNAISKTVGADFIDTFPTYDVLYNFQQWTIIFENNLSDGDIIAFGGTPYIPVIAIASDNTSIATYGVREKLIEDTKINDINVARKRALAEVTAYKDPLQEAQFDTYTAGLRAGQVLTINSARRSVDTDFIIRTVTFQMRTPDTFAYTIQLVTIKAFTLIEVLQSLLQPADQPIDPNEVSEIIKAENATMTMADTTPTKTDLTPPFKWGVDTSPTKGVWNKSQWS